MLKSWATLASYKTREFILLRWQEQPKESLIEEGGPRAESGSTNTNEAFVGPGFTGVGGYLSTKEGQVVNYPRTVPPLEDCHNIGYGF